MNAFLLIVRHQLRARVVGMQLYLVDSRDRLARGVTEKFLKVFDAEVRHADAANFAGGWEFLQFLPLMFVGTVRKRSEAQSTYHVLMKFQSGRCFDLSFGSVEDGQCYFT